MSLNVDIDLSPFTWEWPEDPDVTVRLKPISPGMARAAAKKAGVKASDAHRTTDEALEAILEMAHRSILEWDGISMNGHKLKADKKGIERVADAYPDLLVDAVIAAQEEYSERRQAREDDTEGNSDEPQSG